MSTRINKYLSELGVCSRRQADKLIENRRVKVDGEIIGLGFCIEENQVVEIDGKQVSGKPKKLYYKYNKPKGIVCTTAKFDKRNIVDYIGLSERIYPVGRLDKDSTGLILLTNDGSIVNPILKASNYHEKEYLVEVNKDIKDKDINILKRGVVIDGVKTRPCRIKKTSPNSFSIIITQGLNRQIRKMCESVGYRVVSLKRVRIMDIVLGNLKEGEIRELTNKELNSLKSVSKNGDKK